MLDRKRLSISARLTVFAVVFLGVVAVLGALSLNRLMVIDEQTEAVRDRWLATARVLNNLEEAVSSFRIAEADLARSTAAREVTIARLDVLRREIETLGQRYEALRNGDTSRASLAGFTMAWQTYLATHDAWLLGGASGDREQQALDRGFDRSIMALDVMADIQADAAEFEIDRADRLIDETIALTLAGVAIGSLLVLTLLYRIRQTIAKPLAAIMDALMRLAAGECVQSVPGTERRDEIGAMARAFEVFRANAAALERAHEETRAAQKQAQSLARHDALTGLPNRRVFSVELQAAVARSLGEGISYAVMLLDLDRFKPVNDIQGHAVGDTVLCEVARRLREIVRREDTVARLGGDEFAVVAAADGGDPREGVMRLASRLIAAIREPIAIGDGAVEVGASIGIAWCPADGRDAESLLRAADIAMYRAKRDGRSTYRFFEQSMDEELRDRAALEADLRKAIGEERLEPHYQPLVDMRDGHVYGFEVLARWNHPTRGWIRPDVFIPLAEQIGLISDLTWSLLRRACRDSRQWSDDIRLALNISPVQLKDPLLPNQILGILAEEGFAPTRLEIEVTETALVSDLKTAKAILSSLRSNGVRIALDDFGTGYSSLYHLRELKFDKVKIDRSFVQSMQTSSDSRKIVDAIVSLAKTLGLPTVAEGIEDKAVLDHLASIGCDFGQGFYLGRAMPAEAAVERLDPHDAGGARGAA
nr:EAL domain-containing protein [Prosthecomicrobium pneumaticum]